ncbi:MAG: RNA methyltransferase [Synechococcales cyanobacterium RU_4_20]|nr:RNA methyltransferase [Synechococcales cyanobacterium RU_4_20]NJR68298.1 RNA methyltransferase [Synechococcales cyanobacterium CRU_2_2]
MDPYPGAEAAQASLAHIRIVLVEPAGPLNVGSVARVMKNFGLSQLVLVNPQCDPWCDQARMMAVHAGELLGQANCVASLPEALVGVQRAIATTGLDHDFPMRLESPRQVLPWLVQSSTVPPLTSALIFGREDNGLSSQELHYAQRLLHIPSHAGYTSLNLAQAVAVCCYELAQIDTLAASEQIAIASAPIPPSALPAPQESLEALYQQLQGVLLKIGYLYPHTAASRMKRFRHLGNRSQPSSHEVRMLRGILRQMEWALRCQTLRP